MKKIVIKNLSVGQILLVIAFTVLTIVSILLFPKVFDKIVWGSLYLLQIFVVITFYNTQKLHKMLRWIWAIVNTILVIIWILIQTGRL